MARPMKKNYDPEVVMKTLIQTVEEGKRKVLGVF